MAHGCGSSRVGNMPVVPSVPLKPISSAIRACPMVPSVPLAREQHLAGCHFKGATPMAHSLHVRAAQSLLRKTFSSTPVNPASVDGRSHPSDQGVTP